MVCTLGYFLSFFVVAIAAWWLCSVSALSRTGASSEYARHPPPGRGCGGGSGGGGRGYASQGGAQGGHREIDLSPRSYAGRGDGRGRGGDYRRVVGSQLSGMHPGSGGVPRANNDYWEQRRRADADANAASIELGIDEAGDAGGGSADGHGATSIVGDGHMYGGGGEDATSASDVLMGKGGGEGDGDEDGEVDAHSAVKDDDDDDDDDDDEDGGGGGGGGGGANGGERKDAAEAPAGGVLAGDDEDEDDGEGEGDEARGLSSRDLVPASPAVTLDDNDDDEDDEGERERLPKRRRFEDHPPNQAATPAAAPPAAASAAMPPPSNGAAAAPSTGGASVGGASSAGAPAGAAVKKARLFLPMSDKTIEVPLKVTVREMLLWEENKLKAEGKAVPGDGLMAGGWLGCEPVPLSRSLGEVTECLYAPPDAQRISVRAMPLTSAWGMEAVRRTVLVCVALAASRLRLTTQPTLKLVTSHGMYLSITKAPGTHAREHESTLRRIASDLHTTLQAVIKEDLPIVERTLCLPEALGCFQRRASPLAEAGVRAARSSGVRVHYCGGAAAIAHGYYTAVALPTTGALASARFQLVPLIGPHGLFLQMEPPTTGVPRELPPLSDAVERALLIAVSEQDDAARSLQADTVSRLNEVVSGGEATCKRHIEFVEAQLVRRIASLAERIVNNNRPRLILLTSPPCGGAACIAHALELQLRLREVRGIAIDVACWSKPAAAGSAMNGASATANGGGGLRTSEMRADLATLFSVGHVQIRGRDGLEPTTLELPAGGYVMLFGEELSEVGLGGGVLASGASTDPLAELPKPHYRMQAVPFCGVSLDESSCIGGHQLLLLRSLAMAVATGGSTAAVLGAMHAWLRRRPVDRGQVELHAVAASEWKPLNFSFAYELPLYASVLTPILANVPASDDAYAEARRLLDMLAPLHPLPLAWLPTNSPARTFAGGAWL